MKLLRLLTGHFWQRWLPLATLATVAALLVYGAVQQNYRQSANDPQIQIAEDTAAALESGTPTSAFAPGRVVDIDKSLAPYLIIYDENLKVLTSTGRLDNQTPTPPKGVFESAKGHSDNRLTWEPKAGVRSAIVVRPFDGASQGFVLAGRSLREVEVRESELMAGVFIGWLVALLATAVAVNITDPR